MLARARSCLALSTLFVLAACGGGVASMPTQSAPPNGPEGPSLASLGTSMTPAPASASSAAPGNDAHKLAIAAIACWFGGVWGDAMGEAPDQRKAGDEARCNEVVRMAYGADDKGRYEKLRALDAAAVDDVVSRVGGGGSELGKLVAAFAIAQREAMDARRAGDKVKKDLTGGREPEKLTGDEAASVKALTAQEALAGLMKLDDGALTNEAKGLAVMTAMERLESSRGLPKHLKVYAMQGPINVLFGVAPPAMPTDATQRLPKGAYLAYVADAAKAAGHPVPDAVTAPRDREPLAWAGVLAGISDKMKPIAQAVTSDSPLDDVLDRIVKRLDAQVDAEKNAIATKTPTPPPTSKTPAPVVPPVKSTPAPAKPAPAAKPPAH